MHKKLFSSVLVLLLLTVLSVYHSGIADSAAEDFLNEWHKNPLKDLPANDMIKRTAAEAAQSPTPAMRGDFAGRVDIGGGLRCKCARLWADTAGRESPYLHRLPKAGPR